MERLHPEGIADAVVYIACSPRRRAVNEIAVRPPPRRSELPPVSLLAGGNDSFGHGVLQPALAVRVASSAAWQEWPMSRLVVPLSWRYARREPG